MSTLDPATGEERRGSSPVPLMLAMNYRRTNPQLGVLAKHHAVTNVRVHVTEAFTAGVTLKVGNPGDDDAYITALAVDSTGWKTVTLGAGVGYSAVVQQIEAKLSGTPTAGKLLVIVEFMLTPRVN